MTPDYRRFKDGHSTFKIQEEDPDIVHSFIELNKKMPSVYQVTGTFIYDEWLKFFENKYPGKHLISWKMEIDEYRQVVIQVETGGQVIFIRSGRTRYTQPDLFNLNETQKKYADPRGLLNFSDFDILYDPEFGLPGEFVKDIQLKKVEDSEKVNKIHLICQDPDIGLYTKEFPIQGDHYDFDLDLHYGAGMQEFHDKQIKRLVGGSKGIILFYGDPGTGKCHRKGDQVLTYTMNKKNVEDVMLGDLLMGDDSKPRKVMSLARGTGEMFEIKPNKGSSFFVNADHILCVVDTRTNIIDEIMVKDYLLLSPTQQINKKLYKVGIDFSYQEVNIDPYWLGMWLGDGCSHSSGITIADTEPELLAYHEKYSNDLGLDINIWNNDSNTGCKLYAPIVDKTSKKWGTATNPITEKLKSYNLSGYKSGTERKRIPIEFIHNSREVRLQLLAGLIDSDGSLSGNGCYEITLKSENLIDDIALLSRSLGYLVTKKPKTCTIKSIGFSGLYYRLHISGANDLPCKLARKQSGPRKQIKNIARTGFKIIPIGKDDYYGFTISDNGRYLMHDFIVTHNSFYIKRLCKDLFKVDKKILYLPNNMVDNIGTPSFNNFLLDWADDNIESKTKKGILIIIEDAERVLLKREGNPYGADGVSNILNSTDGILNDFLNIQVLATFNTSLDKIDDAIMRKKRALAIREFKKLTIEESQKLIDHLEADSTATEAMSLADIFSITEEDEDATLFSDKKKDKKGIGFKN